MSRGGVGRMVAVLGVGLYMAVAAATAQGDAPALLWQVPEESGPPSAAGQLGDPSGVAADPVSGDIIVDEKSNFRISEFDVWGRFVKAWGWGVVNGSPEWQSCGPGATPPTSTCQAGLGGFGAGQINRPWGLAVDSSGDVYVDEFVASPEDFGEVSFRIQKFNPAGEFLWMAGGGVNKTTGENLCTKADVEGGDECGSGVPGNAPGQFGFMEPGIAGTRIAVGPSDDVFMGDVERIQEFDANGSFKGQVKVPGETVSSLAVDSAGNFLVTYGLEGGARVAKDDVRKLNPSGLELASFPASSPKALAVSPSDNLYVVAKPSNEFENRIFEYASDGTRLIPGKAEEEAGILFDASLVIPGIAVNAGTDCNLPGEDLYASAFTKSGGALKAFGVPPDPESCAPPTKPPTITDQWATSVSSDSAAVRAEINPHFWPDTRYYVEYGVEPCSSGGCTQQQPVAPGAALGSKVVALPQRTGAVQLVELQPDTRYFYRFVSASGGGGPVRGVGGTFGSDGGEGEFKTYPAKGPLPPDNCPNADRRQSSSARLPDCRAYEMVSPVDKNGSDITIVGTEFTPATYYQSSETGGGLAYSTYRAFGNAVSSPWTSVYLASRGESGWASQAISPPRGNNLLELLASADVEYKYFSPDLCSGWLLHDSDTLLAANAIEGFANLYRRTDCGPEADAYTALTTVPPPNQKVKLFIPELQGVSADGTRAIFRANDELTPDAPPLLPLLYEAFGAGKLRLVCILPNGMPVAKGCSAGTASSSFDDTRHHAVHNAISADGQLIYWSDTAEEPGRIYLRVNGKGPTIPVSGPIASDPAQYLTAADDGTKALFMFTQGTHQGDLYEFTYPALERKKIAGGVLGILGASEDASKVYLVSEEVLDSGAVAGKPNLYFHDGAGGGSAFDFIATLPPRDAQQGKTVEFSPLNNDPSRRTARVTPDGMHVAFASVGSLTGFDNKDVNSGEPDGEVYWYSAAEKELLCVSCNATGARPTGRFLGGEARGNWISGRLRTAEKQLYSQRELATDGKRLFFESFDSLVPGDTNQSQDVYQWELPGEGGCTESGSSFSSSAGGCVDLVSSGESSADSRFIDASASGDDVFFATDSTLVSSDPGLTDIYDARVGGGFAEEASPAICEGEGCVVGAAPREDGTPASATFSGQGNITPRKPQHCRKQQRQGRHKGQGRRCGGKRHHRNHRSKGKAGA